MINRCPDCNKFVGLEIADLDVQDLDVDDEGNVTASARLVLTCAECSGERAETTFDFDEIPEGLAEHILQHWTNDPVVGEDFSLSADVTGTDANDRYADLDRHGKPIKNWRYKKHFYGAELEVTVSCSCGDMFTVEFSDECQASAMDEL